MTPANAEAAIENRNLYTVPASLSASRSPDVKLSNHSGQQISLTISAAWVVMLSFEYAECTTVSR